MEYRQRRTGQQPQKKRRFTPAADVEPASRHYAGHSAGIHPEDSPHLTTADVRSHLPATRPPQEPDDYKAGSFIARMAKRYDVGVPVADGVIVRQGNEQVYFHKGPRPVIDRASRTQAQLPPPRNTEQVPAAKPKQQRRGRLHWLFFVGIGLLVMVPGSVTINAIGAWWHTHNDDTTYGRPRTFQTDAVVGHNDSGTHPSHFLALNLNRHILVIEIPGGDPSRSLIYGAGELFGDGQDLAPVTLTFSDVNGDGKVDMLVHVTDQTIIFLNNGTKFLPPANVVTIGGGSSSPTLED